MQFGYIFCLLFQLKTLLTSKDLLFLKLKAKQHCHTFLFVFASKQKGKNKFWAETENILKRSEEKTRVKKKKEFSYCRSNNVKENAEVFLL